MTALIHLLIKVQMISNVTNNVRSGTPPAGGPNGINKLVMENTMQVFYETNAVFYTFIYFYPSADGLHSKEMLTNMIRRLDCTVQSN